MMFDDLLDILFTCDLDVVFGLLYVHAIESFDDSKLVNRVGHKLFNVFFDGGGYVNCFGADKKVIYLAKD